MKTAANIIGTVTLVLFALGTAVISDWSLADENYDVCPIGKPIASWDFSKGDLPSQNNSVVYWHGDHGGIVDIPNTDLKGIKFKYKGKGPTGDATSEWRYTINQPLSRTWEYLRFRQPENFYHRHYIRLDAPTELDSNQWNIGDEIVNSKNMSAKVGAVSNNYLYIYNFSQRFDYNWGKGKKITNLNSGAFFVSEDSRNLGTNNKFSAQWEDKYSSGGMIVEFETIEPENSGVNGVGYVRPTITRSQAHKASGTINNKLRKLPGELFDPVDNGQTIEIVIERIKSSEKDVRDGSYKIWKRTENTDWNLIHANTSIYAWQPNNYFDHGYVLGWSNSGYSEDTIFYLLGWQLWAEKPTFLP